ncbi:LD-carboxypeptidase [Rhodoferax sp. U2-2l]|uniref:LD-carboxypeptidase n=1 Tax=Rhodoferax sp. U2-2l TaxID=2884000 RepID=UPI001D09DBD5|nr:LD-carboxypeptidase [Rhodoferax sp. U2-2l]MCB8747902.1 LD-carboxypeptidase [Rhodoferax sp. U2-2l]
MTKHIYIYSPSGAVRDKAAFKRGIQRLQTLGHEVEVDVAALASQQRFAGDDATRLAAIHRAADSGADVALISRGGYGLTRLLPDVRYKKVAKAIDKGLQFVGISDFTAFQSALLAKTGAITWAGPALGEGFGVEGTPDDIMEACFDDMLCGQGEGTGWRQARQSVVSDAPLVASNPDATRSENSFGIEDAVLWGGNLTVLTALLGTPYFPNIKGGILFLEDVAEHPYRVERMLTQLLYAGVLKRQKAVVLGQFTDFKLTPHDRGFNMTTVVQWLRQHIKAPILTNLPYGHVQTKVLLPVGAKTDLRIDSRDVLLVWGHI